MFFKLIIPVILGIVVGVILMTALERFKKRLRLEVEKQAKEELEKQVHQVRISLLKDTESEDLIEELASREDLLRLERKVDNRK